MNSKTAQAWGFDLTVGIVIFLAGILFFYFYAINNSGGSEEEILILNGEAKLVSDNLLTEGTPLNWDISNVVRIGIVDNGKINQTKLENYYFMAQNDYQRTKSLFRIVNNYYVYFPDGVNNGTGNVTIIGNNNTENANNIMKISRAVIYENKIVGMEVVVWN